MSNAVEIRGRRLERGRAPFRIDDLSQKAPAKGLFKRLGITKLESTTKSGEVEVRTLDTVSLDGTSEFSRIRRVCGEILVKYSDVPT